MERFIDWLDSNTFTRSIALTLICMLIMWTAIGYYWFAYWMADGKAWGWIPFFSLWIPTCIPTLGYALYLHRGEKVKEKDNA